MKASHGTIATPSLGLPAAEQFRLMLQQAGYSDTQPRRLLFSTLSDGQPRSMAELVAELKGRMDRASVYRGIALFEELAVVRRINIGWKYKIELSDRFSDHHHHLTCLGCQQVWPINEQEFEGFVERLTARHHFRPSDHQIEIQGYCRDCQRLNK